MSNKTTSHIESKRKLHVNVGTIGHIDHGKTMIARSVLSTGDCLDPATWTPEDHERFKKAIELVRDLEHPENAEIRRAVSMSCHIIVDGDSKWTK